MVARKTGHERVDYELVHVVLQRGVVGVVGGEGFFFFQAEDGIRDAQESRGLGDVYKRQGRGRATSPRVPSAPAYSPRVDVEYHPRHGCAVMDLSLIHI